MKQSIQPQSTIELLRFYAPEAAKLHGRAGARDFVASRQKMLAVTMGGKSTRSDSKEKIYDETMYFTYLGDEAGFLELYLSERTNQKNHIHYPCIEKGLLLLNPSYSKNIAGKIIMGPDPKILDDIARIAGGAVNVASGMQQQFREEMRTRMEDMAAQMDLVPREDLEQAMAMIAKLEERIDTIERRLAKLEPKKATKKAAKKAPGKSTTKKTK